MGGLTLWKRDLARPTPWVPTFDGTGTNFAIYSSVATSVTLCLLDDDLNEMRIPMTEVDAYVWHVYVPQVRAGQLYGYRIDGPWDLRRTVCVVTLRSSFLTPMRRRSRAS